MTAPRAVLPTLTEIIEITPRSTAAALPSATESMPLEMMPGPFATPAVEDSMQLVERVLLRLQPRIEAQLETILREALAVSMTQLTPLLAQALQHDARAELAAGLRELVAGAVADELQAARIDPRGE